MKATSPFRAFPAIAVALVFTLLVGACSDSEPTGPTIPPNAAAILPASSKAMGEVDTVRFTLARTGAPVHIDNADLLVFEDAEGRFAAPNSADAVVKISAFDINVNIGAIAIDGVTYLTNPISGDWEKAPASYAFDPATLFDPELGWRPLLIDGLTDVTFVGTEDRDAGSLYHVQGTAAAERVEVITARLVRNQAVVLDMWIDPSTGYIREVEFPATTSAGVSQWRLTFNEYGSPVEITVPDLDGGA